MSMSSRDEKMGTVPPPQPAQQDNSVSAWRSVRAARVRFLIFAVAAVVLLANYGQRVVLTINLNTSASTAECDALNASEATEWTTEDWDKLPTLKHLNYTACYPGFQCARLELPLDHFNGTTNATISLAVIRKPAAVNVTSEKYGGAIMFNPGGPGGSGVSFMRSAGYGLQTIVDSTEDGPNAQYFDLISFDPRGIGRSEPAVHCFASAESFRQSQTKTGAHGLLTMSDAVLDQEWASVHAIGGSCASNAGRDDIKHYVSTASVATDMLALTEAHGAWREAEAKRILAASPHRRLTTDIIVPENLRHKVDGELINYWGFSYGTVLGNTFAAMYPQRIRRFILDGNVDIVDYVKNLWLTAVETTEDALNLFFYHCARVGPAGCAFAEEGMTAANITLKFEQLSKSLRHDPLPIFDPNPDVMDYGTMLGGLFVSLYSPLRAWPYTAKLLQAIHVGIDVGHMIMPNLTALSASMGQNENLNLLVKDKKQDLDSDNFAYSNQAVLCTDGDSSTYLTKSEFPEYIAQAVAVSPRFGALLSHLRLGCSGWPIRAVHRFTGPFTGKTSHPILFASSTADPVTPLASAKKNSKEYEGSVVLAVDGPGHCSISVVSLKAVDHIRKYLHDGILPPEGTVCPPTVLPFGPSKGEEVATLSVGDQVMVDALTDVREALKLDIGIGRTGLI